MGAAQLWKDHSSALVEVQRVRRESLERLRAQHDTQNQNMEANLDLVLDRMRQGSTEEVRGREGGRERLKETCISSGAGAVSARGCEAAGSYSCRVSEGRRKWLVRSQSHPTTHTHTCTPHLSYGQFHQAVLEEVSLWPAAVQKLLATYETSLCQYFGVGRAEPSAKVSPQPRAS